MLCIKPYSDGYHVPWKNFDRSIETGWHSLPRTEEASLFEECSAQRLARIKVTLLALIPGKPYPLYKTNPNMDDITVLGKLFIGVCSCFDSLNTTEKARVAHFLEFYSTMFVDDTVPPRLQKKISTVLLALNSPEKPNPIFANVQKIFSTYRACAWGKTQKEEVNRLFE